MKILQKVFDKIKYNKLKQKKNQVDGEHGNPTGKIESQGQEKESETS